MPRVIITHRVHDVEAWLDVARGISADLVGADAVAHFVCVDDVAKTGVVLDYPDGADARLLVAATGALPGIDELMTRLGVVRETVEIYVERPPGLTARIDDHQHEEGPEPG